MIINRNDYHLFAEDMGYGVGYELLKNSSYCQQEVDFSLALLSKRRVNFGPGVVAIDCGANIGVHTVEWAKLMHDWGEVISFEAQEKIYYALAGNIAINNCLNVTARLAAVGDHCGEIEVPQLNYLSPASFGSLELQKTEQNENIGQQVDYANTKPVPLVTIDSLHLKRLDFIKIDVEGMEEAVLMGAKESIQQFHPIMMIEVIKSNQSAIEDFLTEMGYQFYGAGLNLLAVHQEDPVSYSITSDLTRA